MADDDGSLANRLLARLPQSDSELLRRSLSVVSCVQGVVLNQPGDEVEHVYFPHAGMVSLLAVMQNGKAVETATVGREGGVGTMAGLGTHITLTRSVVQIPIVASRIGVIPFRAAVQISTHLRNLVVRYNDILLGQVQVTAACNALHPIQARLARWILQTGDRLDDDVVPLTHELLSEMLGVRRNSVSQAAKTLQDANLIQYRRGFVTVMDREGLERMACECLETLRTQGRGIA